MTQQVIIITGTPGVGKTTISQRLANQLDGKHISISALVQQEQLIKSRDPQRDTVVIDSARLSQRLQQIISNQTKPIILDTHDTTQNFEKINISLVVVIRLDPDELTKRLYARKYHESKIFENVAAEILDVCLLDAVQHFKEKVVTEINATNRDIEEIVDIIIKTLEGEIKTHIGWVNWLEKLENEKRLESFFTYLNGNHDTLAYPPD
jgi:adenylate kinase